MWVRQAFATAAITFVRLAIASGPDISIDLLSGL
jgi:hypothetical protein